MYTPLPVLHPTFHVVQVYEHGNLPDSEYCDTVREGVAALTTSSLHQVRLVRLLRILKVHGSTHTRTPPFACIENNDEVELAMEDKI
ncbi:hypothetical protein EUX98_g5940 [Antrodiella citrinella]|uniref:Uncharacterized protein n=1 Tax=Antrodiella citrinella TaxID=2447956 RepID=A0A4S4MR73_9APHY|nr:hypothetical protein EUX98_g5940 [Antrodiella citrinella]